MADFLGALAQVGLDVYLDAEDTVRLRPAGRLADRVGAALVAAALPKVRRRREEIADYLRRQRREALEGLLALGIVPATNPDTE